MKRLNPFVVAAIAILPAVSYAASPVIPTQYVGEPVLGGSNECDWMNPKPAHCFPVQPASAGTLNVTTMPEVTDIPSPIQSTGVQHSEIHSNGSYRCTLIVRSSSACGGLGPFTHDMENGIYESPYDAEIVDHAFNQRTLVRKRMPDGALSWDFAPDSAISIDKVPAAIRSPSFRNNSQARGRDFELSSDHDDHGRLIIKRILDEQPLVQKRMPDGTLSWDFSPVR